MTNLPSNDEITRFDGNKMSKATFYTSVRSKGTHYALTDMQITARQFWNENRM